MLNKKYIKILLAILISLILLLIGYVFGFYEGMQTAKMADSMGNDFLIAMHGQHAYFQYQNAEHNEAREALINFVDVLNKALSTKKGDNLFLNENSLNFDLALTYSRLAMLEEKAGNTEAMKQFFEKSKVTFKQINYDYDVDKIREIVAKMD